MAVCTLAGTASIKLCSTALLVMLLDILQAQCARNTVLLSLSLRDSMQATNRQQCTCVALHSNHAANSIYLLMA